MRTYNTHTEGAGDETQSTDSKEERTTNNPDDSENSSHLARRGVVLGLLGATGLGMVGSQPAAAQSSRPWNQDVNADGHELMNLGALHMAADSAPITSFETADLSIENGTLRTNVAEGWGASGEKILLTSLSLGVTGGSSPNEYFKANNPVIIPFESLSFTNIAQKYVSFTGEGDSGTTVGFNQPDENQPLPESEYQIPEDGSFHTHKVPYDPGEVTPVTVYWTGGDFRKNLTKFHVWGEIE